MNYAKIYSLLIEKVKTQNRDKNGKVYYEKHHIVPKCKSGSDDSTNLVLLTAKEHFIAHHLLWKTYGCSKTYHAYFIMQYGVGKQKTKRKHKISAKSYEIARTNHSKYMSELGKQGGNATAKSNKKHNEDITKYASKGGKSKSLEERQKLGLITHASGALKIASNSFVGKKTKERELALANAGLPKEYKPTRAEASLYKLNFFYGKVCLLHPELNGLRRRKDCSCSKCTHSK